MYEGILESVGGFTGGIGSSTFTIAIPQMALLQTTFGTLELVVVGATTVTVNGLVVAGAGIVGASIIFSRIGKSNGYTIDHHYPNDHAPTHVHIKGDDGMTRVEINGNPIQNDRPMTAVERKAFRNLIKEIIKQLKPWM